MGSDLELNVSNSNFQDSNMSLFKEIKIGDLSTKDNNLYFMIYNETNDISSFLKDSIEKFHLLFNKNFKDFDDCLNYLETIAIPNKCVCAGVIDKKPGWRCVDCSKYENAIYCSDCYIKTKDLHKNHKVVFLFSSSGMCDCGDPDSLYTFCPEHSGPYENKKQLDDYISKTFEKETLINLEVFFDDLFLRFSKYLILTEKCQYFIKVSFDEKFRNNLNVAKEKEDILLLKQNFCIVFQNLLHFLRLISEKNLGMLYLIANYFLKNHFENQKLDEKYKTTHRCIQLTENDIQLLYSDKQEHICICPFTRLFLSNYREDIICTRNQELLLSFIHNYFLRNSYCKIFFSIYEQIMLNKNDDIIDFRNQFYVEDVSAFIAQKTELIEESYNFLYNYLLINFKSPYIKNEFGSINEELIRKFQFYANCLIVDTRFYSKPKIRNFMTKKTCIVKRIIDSICLMHNQNEFRSIVPHPQFQEKSFSLKLCELEFKLLSIVEQINIFIEWDKTEYIKDIFNYIINKIINQEKEGIKQLKEDEYTYHLGLYRCFGLLLNCFCFNYAFKKDCTLVNAIQFFKKSFFISQNQVELFVDILLKDYFKFFGFIAGTNNNYFNYYDSLSNYSNIYFLIEESYLLDFSLLKYLIVMTDRKIDLISYYKASNIENIYSSFLKSFIIDSKSTQNNEKIDIDNNKNNNLDKKELTLSNNNDVNININNNESQNDNRNELSQLIYSRLRRQINPENILRFVLVLDNNNISDNNRNLNDEKKKDESNLIMQWGLLFDMIICFMKDDSCPYSNLMREYIEILSSQTKRDLFNIVKKNKYAMEDLKNILKEKLLHQIIAKGNLIDLEKITQKLYSYLKILFEENNEFYKMIDEITYNKMNGETKMFYLKDSYLKQFDLNYYFCFKDKSDAQRYILDFKKDIIKSYNNYYYNPSKLTFEFFEIVYEKILLNKNNLELMIKMVEKLLSNEKITEELDIKSVRNSLLPIILNYLSMFGVINTKSFIEFKIENKDLINKLCQIFSDSISNNINNNFIEKDLEDNIKEVINQLNRYHVIYERLNNDLSKLNEYDYNIDILEKLKQNEIEKNLNKKTNQHLIEENLGNKKKQLNNIRDKYKNLMKKKANLFMGNVISNQNMLQAINEQVDKENINGSNKEVICFFCRNPIKLDSFKVPYGKSGLKIKDYFFINSIKSSIRAELSKLIKNEIDKNKIYEEIIENVDSEYYNRIISCGHYFHYSCFKEGCDKNENEEDEFDNNDNNNNEFTCSLCLKKQNILIPLLDIFQDKYIFFKSEDINELFNENINIRKFEQNDDSNLFKNNIEKFLEENDLNISEDKDYFTFLNKKYQYYKSYFNFYENIFYLDTTTFHKHQQINTLQNINLSLRFIIKTNGFYINQIIKYIKDEFINLATGPNTEKFIYDYDDSYMHYANLLEKILLSLLLLFNYDDMKKTFKYIIYIFLPYFIFGFFFRDLILKNDHKFDYKEKMTMNNLENYIKDNNNQLIKNFIFFLKKFTLIKLISDFNNKNEEIINSFNELALDNLFQILEMDDLYELLPKNVNNEIYFLDIINTLPKIFNKNELFYKLFGNYFNHKNIFISIFDNIIKEGDNIAYYEKEFIIQFSPIKFDFIHLDKNIFDWIENNLGKKCDICNKLSRYSLICLLCGNKICHFRDSPFHFLSHTRTCGGKKCIFVNMDNMTILLRTDTDSKKLFPIYVNKSGNGPQGYEIGNEYYLSREKLRLAIKNYACDDF